MVGVERSWHPAGDGENLFSSALSHIICPMRQIALQGMRQCKTRDIPLFRLIRINTSVFPLNAFHVPQIEF